MPAGSIPSTTMSRDSGDRPFRPTEAETEHEVSALDWARRQGRTDHFLETLATRLRRRHRWQAASASLAAVLGFATVTWWGGREPIRATESIASTVSTLPESRRLPDGSLVERDAGAEFSVEFSGSARRIVLKRGAAHFNVAKNRIPFVVVADGVEVSAVGTAFSVQIERGGIEVLVTEGRVRVEKPPGSLFPQTELLT